MRTNSLIIVLCIELLSFVTIAKAGDGLECSSAEEFGQKAYDRTATAYNSGDTNTAIMYSKAFWDIYESNGSCIFLKNLASRLNSIGITNSSVVSCPQSNKIPLGIAALSNDCKPTPPKIKTKTMSESGGGGFYRGIIIFDNIGQRHHGIDKFGQIVDP